MAEYIKREAAICEIEQINPVDYGAMWDYETHHWAGECLRDCKEAIDSIPAADVAPVVRCKECEHAERYERTDGTVGYYCGHPQNTFTYGERWDRAFKPAKEADDFCSYGERRAKP